MNPNLPEQPVPEPEGFSCQRGYVKARYENNRFYVDQYERSPEYPALVALVDEFASLCPKVNIAQIKWEFNNLTIYYDVPKDIDFEKDCPKWINNEAELRASLSIAVARCYGWCKGYAAGLKASS